MIKRMIIMIVALVAIAGGFAAYKIHAMHAGMAAMQASFAPPTVSTVKAETMDWQPKQDSVGTLRAINGSDLSSEVSGIVQSLTFESGADVAKGTILVQLRADDEIAQLHVLQAAAKIAQVTLDRDMKQVKAQVIAQATVDNDEATLNGAKAQVDAQEATIEKKTVRAPFAGHLGIRQVDIGQYLSPGAPIVTLQQLDPIYVDFTLPEQSLPSIEVGQKVAFKSDAFADQDFVGSVSAINAKIDDATRNIFIRATFKNPDHKLLPGMFGHIAVDTGKVQHFITLPQTAIVFNTYGSTVYLVQKADGKTTVQQSVIVPGGTRGDQIAVLSGVKDGDEVVTSGQVKLRNGTPIIVNNDNQPASDPNPKPHEQ